MATGSQTARRLFNRQGSDDAPEPITNTTITPSPGTDTEQGSNHRSVLDHFKLPLKGRLSAPKPPLAGSRYLRLAMSVILAGLCVLTIGGSVLVLLLWEQERSSAVLTSQLDRTWDLFDVLRAAERYFALAVIPFAVFWIVLAVINVRRATGVRRDPLIAAGSLLVGIAGIWLIGSQIVAPADDWKGRVLGFALQISFASIPLLALERVSDAADARRRPLRAAYLFSLLYLANLQFLAGLATADRTTESTRWAELGAYLLIGGLLEAFAVLSVNEAARSIEEGSENRFALRERFGESVLAQVAAI